MGPYEINWDCAFQIDHWMFIPFGINRMRQNTWTDRSQDYVAV